MGTQSLTPAHIPLEEGIILRRFKPEDAQDVSELICHTLLISNSADYPEDYISSGVKNHTPESVLAQAADSHFYVAEYKRRIIGCGGIAGYWGSETESYIQSVFVLPEYQSQGIGRKIMETLESDEYFLRAWRTELGSSITAVGFYLSIGYSLKYANTDPDEFGVIRMEKRNPDIMIQ